ncbi:uncharacterized protein [Drosophila bipectinata]|uniref:uncharacterized protein n=1 Tax=Drosophila bipectinata TaxID=42026 RepID=UPI001C897528|nr:uncharacterized protein LOC108133530 [Drosophila bipectinata]
MEDELKAELNQPVEKTTNKGTQLTRLVKLRVLRYLKANGFSQGILKEAAQYQNVDYTDAAFSYIAKTCPEAEDSVKLECDSVSLNNITEWLELLKAAGLSDLCEFEAAAVVNSIIQNEKQPKPKSLNGIDLKQAYKFLDNALMGLPQKELSDATKAFLSKEIELLIAEANTDESDDVARSMGQSLYHQQEFNFIAHPEKCSRDPLFLDRDQT